MAKYIDLLREHQKEAPAPAKGKKKSTRKKKATSGETNLDELQSMLPDESEAATSMQGSPPVNADEELLIDEAGSTAEAFTTSSITKTEETAPEHFDGLAGNWLTKCNEEILQIFKAASTNESADIQSLTSHLNAFLQSAEEEPTRIDALELEISTREKQIGEVDSNLGPLIQKSVMMMLYAIKMGVRLKQNREVHRSHILAAMLHHIGLAQIPPELRNKKEKLSDEEFEEIHKAPQIAHDFLSRCGITDAAILLAAGQTRERFDGSGPQGLSGSDIAFSARMTSLLSMFEALIHFRPYRSRLLPRDAIRELVNHHKKEFDPNLLKALIESISLYPVGTYVQLNSGDIGLVIRVHPKLPLRPIVRIMLNNRGEKIALREIDLKQQPNLMVKQCMYEENISEHIE